MKSSNFFSGLSWLLLLNAIVKPVWIFGIDRQIQLEVGHEAYGTYFAILSLSIVLSIFSDAGLSNLLNRQLAVQNETAVSSFLRIKILLSLLYLLLLLVVARMSGLERWDIILFCGLLQVVTSFLLFYRTILTGLQFFRDDAWVSVLDKILMILICGSLLYLPFRGARLSIMDFLLIQTGSTSFVLGIAMAIVYRKLQRQNKSFTPPAKIFTSALPFLLLVFLMAAHNRVDAFLLERIHREGSFQAGVYASAYRFLDAGNTVGFLAASFLLPFAARHLRDRQLLDSTVLRIRHLLLLLAVAAVSFTAVYSREMMTVLYGRTDDTHAHMLLYCVSVLPAYYLIHVYGSLLTAMGAIRLFTLIIAGSVLMNVSLNLLLIPSFGALGCGLSALASQYLAAGFCYSKATAALHLNPHGKSLAAYVFTGLALLLLFYLAANPTIPSVIRIILFLLAAALIMFVFVKSIKKNFPSF